MIQSIYHIARNTFRECLRQPIFFILTLVTLLIIVNYPAMSGFVFREQEKLVTDGSLATILVFGWITAVLCASHTISREIDTGTVLLILSKPVGRNVFIIAKIFGILAALTLFVYINGLCTLMALRIAKDQFRIDMKIMTIILVAAVVAALIGGLANYLKKLSFPAIATQSLAILVSLVAFAVYFMPGGEDAPPGEFGGYSLNLVYALILILFAVLALGTLATALSTRLNLVANFTMCAVLFVLGLMSGYFIKSLRDMKLEDFVQLLHASIMVQIPILLGLWLLSAKQYHERRNLKIKKVELHLTFFVLLALLVAQAWVNVVNKVHLQEPTAPMMAVAQGMFAAKDSVAFFLEGLLPDWQLFWVADGLAAKEQVPLAYIGWGGVYVAFFFFLCVSLSTMLFANREVGQQMRG